VLGDLVVKGTFPGLDKAPTPKPEVAASVKVYVMPANTLLPGGVTVWTPAKPHTAGQVVQFQMTFLDVNFPTGANTVRVALVDDDGTENAGVSVVFNATDQGPTEATGVTAVFTPK